MNPYDEEYENLLKKIQYMEEHNKEIFEQLGIAPHQLHAILHNKDTLGVESYEFIQRERKALEEMLDRHLEEVQESLKKERPRKHLPVGGHWIRVR